MVLVGIAGSGKSTFAARHFAPSEILSSDAIRAMVADDPNDQSATDDAFRLLHAALEIRLRRGRFSVVDATNVEPFARTQLLDLAWRYRRPTLAIVLDLDLELCLLRNQSRLDGRRPSAAVRRQHRWLRDSLAELPNEGYEQVVRLTTLGQVEAFQLVRRPLAGTAKRPEGTGVRRSRPKPPRRCRNR